MEEKNTAYKQHLNSLKGELQILQTQIDDRSTELQTLKKEYIEQQQVLAQTEKAKLSSKAKTSELAEALTASQELLNQKEEQLNQLTAALEEKASSIELYNNKLQATEELLSLSESKNAINAMNISLILDELRGKSPLSTGKGIQSATGQSGSSATTKMNLTLILDELIQKTQLANALQNKINLLATKGSQSGASQQSQQSIEETSELFKATNAAITMNMSLILDELLAKTQLADELQAQINILKGAKEKSTPPSKVTAVTELQALMEKMGRKQVSLSRVEKQLLEANSQIQELKTSQETLQSNVDDQNALIQTLLTDLQSKEDLLSSANDKLKQQHLNNQATTDELDKLRIETKEANQKLAELQKSIENKDLELETTVKQAHSIAAPLKEKVTSLELQLADALKTNVTLADEKNILNQEFISVKSSLEKALTQVALLTTGIESAKTALQHEEDTRLSLTSEAEGTKLALKQAQEKYTSLSNKFAELEADLTNKTLLQAEQITSLEQQLVKTNVTFADEKSALIAQLAELQSTNDSLSKELVPAQASLKEALAQVAQLTTDIQTARQQEEARLSARTEAEATKLALEQAQKKYTSLKSQYTELEAEFKNTSAKQAEKITSLQGLLQQQTASTEANQGDLGDKLAAATASLKTATDESTGLKSKIEQFSTTVSEQEQTIQDCKLALEQAQEKYTSLKSQHTELEAKLTNTSAKQAEKITSLQGLLQQQTASTEANQGDLGDKLAAATASLKTATDESTGLKSKIEQFSTTVSEQEQTIKDLTDKIAADNSEHELKNTQLLDEITAIKLLSEKQTEEYATRLKEQEATIQSLTTKLTDSTDRLENAQTNLEQINAQLTEKTNHITTKQQEITALVEQAAAVKSITDQQTTELSLTKENLAALREQQNGLETSLSNAQQQLASSQEDVAALQDTVASLTKERDQLLLVSRDSDNDGINDAEDACPDTVQDAKVNVQGCEEDTDNDGLINRLDLCPDTPLGSTIDSVGCAAEQKTVILEGISFQFGTAEFTEEAHSILDSAALILQNNPDIRMEVAGHTDSSGDNNANINLSTRRAEAVLSYLVSAGVAADRLQAKGYGSDKPIADNTNREGRAKNRRVELKRIDSSPVPQNAASAPTTSDSTE